MAEMNDLRTLALQNAAHDIDGGIVPVKQGSGSNDTNFRSLEWVPC